ncbi:putative DNA ligase [Phytophthora cinnamomi]|uniref:putative DNA ligase n=1 Tax=Phytophthora cinnamomi TaxID=4785 RepID=UPI003559AE03|nr:putative DNA ligase [Phytophthora cinnamomi]
MAKKILFKEQLKWTKAKRDVERSMKINSKHRRELIADMNTRLADLDRKWKASEEERLQLLTHHERVVQQQQQAVECAELEKKKYEMQLQDELFAKEKLGMEAQRRAERERHLLLRQQTYLQAEKIEVEFMSSEDQMEQRRTASSVASDLQQRVSELEARSEALLVAKYELEVDKEQEAQRAAAALERSRIDASMQQIASWVSGQVQLSKLTKEKAAIRESAAHELEEEKRRQRREMEAKIREVTSIKASSTIHQRISQHRNNRTVELIRIQQQQKSAFEKANAERTRAQVVQVIIAAKLLSESESSKGIMQGLGGVLNLQKATKHKYTRLKYLRSMNSARKIQREVGEKEVVVEHEEPAEKPLSEEPVDDQPQIEEPAEDDQELMEIPEEDVTRAGVEMTVDNWSHRELPHILTRSMNQIMFFHDVAAVLQKCVREYQKRQQLHIYFQRAGDIALPSEQCDDDRKLNTEHFHFYFKRTSAWLECGEAKSVFLRTDTTNQAAAILRLRFDSQLTRRLLQLFEPSEEYALSDIQQVLQEIAADAVPILQSPVCAQDHKNVRPELRYHDVEEIELPYSVKLLRGMAQQRAQDRRQQLLEIDTTFEEPPKSPPSPVAKSVPSSPIGKSAPSSPSQRAKKEVTIFTAVENASVEDATFLQQRGANLAAVEPKMQRNALHMLSFSKENYRARADMLEFLLACDAKLDVNSVDCNGDTPLMLYASLGHLEFMQKLLEHGADILKTNRKGQNVLHRACEDDQVEICGFLQQLMMKDSVAEIIIPIEVVSTLAPIALSLHTPDSTGRYPLHCLAEKGFVECAKQIVVPTEANYEWNRMLQAQGDAQGRTALHLAVLTHDAAMTAFLLTPGGGLNVDAFDDLHRSPLHYAVESPAALPIIARLVQHGATVNVADERGDTPLHWAAFSGRAAVAQNLLTLGADPTLVNSDWETPAQIAAAYGQLDCMRLLLQAQRRYGAVTTSEPKEHTLMRPASEKTALQRLEEAVNHLHQRQASTHSNHAAYQDSDLDVLSTNDADGDREAASQAEQSHGYWEELHQDVQLVEESGHFSSEDEEDLLFGHDGDDDLNF